MALGTYMPYIILQTIFSSRNGPKCTHFLQKAFDRNAKNADLIYCIYIINALSIIEDEISNK